ncbi:unnamed protein product [Calypogeia fissa]
MWTAVGQLGWVPAEVDVAEGRRGAGAGADGGSGEPVTTTIAAWRGALGCTSERWREEIAALAAALLLPHGAKGGEGRGGERRRAEGGLSDICSCYLWSSYGCGEGGGGGGGRQGVILLSHERQEC